MIKVIILNGPPACGKDTIGNILKARHPDKVVLTTFKFDLIKESADFFDIEYEAFKVLCADRRLKDGRMEVLGGITPRGALQHVSEVVRKPTFGRDYFGIKARERLGHLLSVNRPTEELFVIFTDGGFAEEIGAIASSFNTTVVQLHGRGTFVGDTRSYIEAGPLNTTYVTLVDDKEEQGATQVAEAVGLR